MRNYVVCAFYSTFSTYIYPNREFEPIITPRTRVRLELEKLRNQNIVSHEEEVRQVYGEVEIRLVIGEKDIVKTLSAGESVSNMKVSISEEFNVHYDNITLYLFTEDQNVAMLDPLTLNDFKYISENRGDIIIKVEIKE